jgi:hypothetical protein
MAKKPAGHNCHSRFLQPGYRFLRPVALRPRLSTGLLILFHCDFFSITSKNVFHRYYNTNSDAEKCEKGINSKMHP